LSCFFFINMSIAFLQIHFLLHYKFWKNHSEINTISLFNNMLLYYSCHCTVHVYCTVHVIVLFLLLYCSCYCTVHVIVLFMLLYCSCYYTVHAIVLSMSLYCSSTITWTAQWHVFSVNVCISFITHETFIGLDYVSNTSSVLKETRTVTRGEHLDSIQISLNYIWNKIKYPWYSKIEIKIVLALCSKGAFNSAF
jgi:hypothetical protein